MSTSESLSAEFVAPRLQLQAICDAFDAAWRSSHAHPPLLEAFLRQGDDAMRPSLLRALLLIDGAHRRKRGLKHGRATWLCRFPELEAVVRGVLAETHTVIVDRLGTTYASDDPHMSFDTKLIGKSLGIYEVRGLLGRGGMGSVYLGWDPRLQQYRAIKVLHPPRSERVRAQLEQFTSEARMAARLNHPNIVTVHALDRQDDLHFIALEFVEGGSLRDRVERDGPLPEADVARWVYHTCSALTHAHRHGVLHRDVKPANVLVGANGRAKLADFGLAAVDGTNVRSSQDNPRRMVGTPMFLAPEVFWARSPHSAASDLYSLGATWYYLLTGRPPHLADSIGELGDLVGQAPITPIDQLRPDIDPDAAHILMAMLEANPEDRPISGGDLLAHLDDLRRAHRPVYEIVRRAMEHEPVAWECQGEDFVFHVRLENGRGQTVHARINEHYGQEFMCFFSPCSPPTPEHLEEAMRLNATLPLGALAIREWEGEPYLVMGHNQPRQSLDPVEVRSTVRYLAYWADYAEARFTERDRH